MTASAPSPESTAKDVRCESRPRRDGSCFFEKPGDEFLDLGHQCWALRRHLPESADNSLVVLVEFDRAATQGFDILMQAVATGLELL
jgi:hypothetical protein